MQSRKKKQEHEFKMKTKYKIELRKKWTQSVINQYIEGN